MTDEPILTPANRREWEAWLRENHAKSAGVWVRIAKKTPGALTYAEALDIALCYGWIDARKKGESAAAWLQRFNPRAKRSIWSKINRQKALALIEAGKMKPAGLKEVDRAKGDGRWEAAYDSPKTATVPEDLQVALDANPRAKAFFATVSSQNRYAVLWRIQTVKKAETRARKIRELVEMLEQGKTIHP
jgi:uncharacterized protein YdeI (YjbR/CyaY-like superfamily)